MIGPKTKIRRDIIPNNLRILPPHIRLLSLKKAKKLKTLKKDKTANETAHTTNTTHV